MNLTKFERGDQIEVPILVTVERDPVEYGGYWVRGGIGQGELTEDEVERAVLIRSRVKPHPPGTVVVNESTGIKYIRTNRITSPPWVGFEHTTFGGTLRDEEVVGFTVLSGLVPEPDPTLVAKAPRYFDVNGEEPPENVRVLTDGGAYVPYLVRCLDGCWAWSSTSELPSKEEDHTDDNNCHWSWRDAAEQAGMSVLKEVV